MSIIKRIIAWNGLYGCESFECYINSYVSTNIKEWIEYYKEKYPFVWVEDE